MPALRQDVGVLSSHPICTQQKQESRTREKTRVEKTCVCVDMVTTKKDGDTERDKFSMGWGPITVRKRVTLNWELFTFQK